MPATRPPRKGARRRKPRPKAAGFPLLKALAGTVLLAAVVLAALLVGRWLSRPPPRVDLTESRPTAAAKQAPTAKAPAVPRKAESEPPAPKPTGRSAGTEAAGAGKLPLYEVFPEKPPSPKTPTAAESDTLHAALPPSPPELPPLKKPPRVAIIIDDVGYDRHLAEKLIDLNAPLTLSILPHSPHQESIARLAHDRGLDVMLHLPMEPVEYPEINPGPGVLLTAMAPDELLRVLEEDLAAVPYIQGVNNHMGSRLTARSEQMYQVFSVLKRRGLFFIDSRTTNESVCRSSARLFQIPFTQRDVFLDHVHDAAFIRKQIRELVRIAQLKGEAVGIAHPHPTTYAILKEELPSLRQQVEIVPVSRLVRVVG
ncbi:MAG: divergent polysaccharide deacetylase family protein [Hyphomicrobiales bacterium]